MDLYLLEDVFRLHLEKKNGEGRLRIGERHPVGIQECLGLGRYSKKEFERARKHGHSVMWTLKLEKGEHLAEAETGLHDWWE